jgi:hypothetical protein
MSFKRKAKKLPTRDEPPRRPRLEERRAGPSNRPAAAHNRVPSTTRPPLPAPNWNKTATTHKTQSRTTPPSTSASASAGVRDKPVKPIEGGAAVSARMMTASTTRPVPQYRPASTKDLPLSGRGSGTQVLEPTSVTSTGSRQPATLLPQSQLATTQTDLLARPAVSQPAESSSGETSTRPTKLHNTSSQPLSPSLLVQPQPSQSTVMPTSPFNIRAPSSSQPTTWKSDVLVRARKTMPHTQKSIPQSTHSLKRVAGNHDVVALFDRQHLYACSSESIQHLTW